MRTDDRFTLAAIVVAAVLAASLAATTLPTASHLPGPILTWAIVYTATVAGLARTAHLPVARTLVAALLLVATALHLALTGLRAGIDAALHLLNTAHNRGLTLLATSGKAQTA